MGTAVAEERIYLTIQDAARIAQVDARTVMRWIKDGKLRAVKRGNVTRIKPEWFESFWEGDESTP